MIIFKLKRAIRNLLILIVYLSGLSKVYRTICFIKNGPLSRVVCFHWVGEEGLSGFEKKIIWLKKHFDIISLDTLVQRQQSSSLNGQEIAITFDDGYVDFPDKVLPIIEKHQIPVTIFVPIGLANRDENEKDEFARKQIGIDKPLMSEKQLLKVSRCHLIELQSHSLTHRDFGNGTKEELTNELLQSAQKIESISGRRVSLFAFPFGDIVNTSSNSIEALKLTRYSSAFTIVPGFNHHSTNKYLLNRDSLEPNMKMLLFTAWMNGSYDLIKTLYNGIRANVKRFSNETYK